MGALLESGLVGNIGLKHLKVIKEELNKVESKSINESVATKLNKTVSTGSSTTLIESKTYENPQFLRMKDLMGKLG